LDSSDAYDQVLESDQRPLWLPSSNNEELKKIKYLAQKGTASEHEALPSPLSQINDHRVHHPPYRSDDDIFDQGQEGHFRNSFISNSHKSSMSPMVITVPTMVDDNDTVLTSSTSDEQIKDGKAAVARTEEEVIVKPLNVCTNTGSEMQEPISVKVRAMLYSKQQKFPYAQSPKSVLPSDLDTKRSIIDHERKAEQGGTRAANQLLPTYFTPTRCWEVAPKPQPFCNHMKQKGLIAENYTTTSYKDTTGPTHSNLNSHRSNDFEKRHFHGSQVKCAAVEGAQQMRKQASNSPTNPQQQNSTAAMPFKYYAVLSSALKINESLRSRIAYLEKELALVAQIETINGSSPSVTKKKPIQRRYTSRNGWAYHSSAE